MVAATTGLPAGAAAAPRVRKERSVGLIQTQWIIFSHNQSNFPCNYQVENQTHNLASQYVS